MPFADLLARPSKGDALIDGDVLADLGGLPYDDARAVVDEQAFTERRARVDLDAGEQPAGLRDEPGRQRDVLLPERVRGTVSARLLPRSVKRRNA